MGTVEVTVRITYKVEDGDELEKLTTSLQSLGVQTLASKGVSFQVEMRKVGG